MVEWGQKRAREVAEAAGGMTDHKSSGVCDVNGTGPGAHLMGTCRMGNSPVESVTNKYNQTWDVPNLFIADGSSLPTGGSVSPTNMIQALTVRCAHYIRSRHRDILAQRTTPANADAPAM